MKDFVELFTKRKNQIQVFASDDINMLKKRLASELNSIPEYIFILKSEEALTTECIYLFDMFNFIKTTSMTSSNIFSDIYREDDKLIYLLNIFNIQDIFIIFLIYNDVLDEQYKQTGFHSDISSTLNDFKDEVLNDFKDNALNNNIEFNYDELNEKWEKREITKIIFKDKINKNKIFVLKSDSVKSEFNSINKPLEYNEFKIEKNRIFAQVQNMPNSILEFFNDIQLNSYIPFASYRDFYKILNGFKPNDKSLNVTDNLELELILNENYIQISLNNKGELTFDCPISISYDNIIEKIKSINLNLELSEPKTIGLNGSFLFNNIMKLLTHLLSLYSRYSIFVIKYFR
jgi:hypothetical protein